MLERDYLRRGVAEFVGTFALIFVAAGGAAYAQTATDLALANGLVIAVMVSAFGFISGGHFNPAVTLGFLITRRIDPKLAGVYWLEQFAGATCAALLLGWIFPTQATDPSHIGAPALNSAIGQGAGLVLEAILTFFLVLAVFATAVDPRGAFKAVAGFGIGLVITMGILCGGPLTGAAMNPARAFGPELVANFWQSYTWIYYVGPPLGAVVAALLYELLFLREPLEPVGPKRTGVQEPRPGDLAES